MSTEFPTGDSMTYTVTDSGLGSISIITPPVAVGYWVMPGGTQAWYTKFAAYEKPRWHVRKMMLWVFGWAWEDAKNT
jgi:hypothetical protein